VCVAVQYLLVQEFKYQILITSLDIYIYIYVQDKPQDYPCAMYVVLINYTECDRRGGGQRGACKCFERPCIVLISIFPSQASLPRFGLLNMLWGFCGPSSRASLHRDRWMLPSVCPKNAMHVANVYAHTHKSLYIIIP
jgi:hypothetical protein